MRCYQSPRGSEAFREEHPTVGSVLRSPFFHRRQEPPNREPPTSWCVSMSMYSFRESHRRPQKYAHGTRDFGKSPLKPINHNFGFRLPAWWTSQSAPNAWTRVLTPEPLLSHAIGKSLLPGSTRRVLNLFAFIHFCGILSGQLSVRDFYGFSIAKLRSQTRLRARYFTRCDGPRRCFNFCCRHDS